MDLQGGSVVTTLCFKTCTRSAYRLVIRNHLNLHPPTVSSPSYVQFLRIEAIEVVILGWILIDPNTMSIDEEGGSDSRKSAISQHQAYVLR